MNSDAEYGTASVTATNTDGKLTYKVILKSDKDAKTYFNDIASPKRSDLP